MSTRPTSSRSLVRWALVAVVCSLLAASCHHDGDTVIAYDPDVSLGYRLHADSPLDQSDRLTHPDAFFTFSDGVLTGLWAYDQGNGPVEYSIAFHGIEDETDYDLDDLNATLCVCEGHTLDAAAEKVSCTKGAELSDAVCFPVSGVLHVETLDETCAGNGCLSSLDATVTARGKYVDLDLDFSREVEISRPTTDCGIGMNVQ